jgi:hypothetical protein
MCQASTWNNKGTRFCVGKPHRTCFDPVDLVVRHGYPCPVRSPGDKPPAAPSKEDPVADNNHFVALSECHFMNPESMEEMSYYPGYERWWKRARTL